MCTREEEEVQDKDRVLDANKKIKTERTEEHHLTFFSLASPSLASLLASPEETLCSVKEALLASFFFDFLRFPLPPLELDAEEAESVSFLSLR